MSLLGGRGLTDVLPPVPVSYAVLRAEYPLANLYAKGAGLVFANARGIVQLFQPARPCDGEADGDASDRPILSVPCVRTDRGEREIGGREMDETDSVKHVFCLHGKKQRHATHGRITFRRRCQGGCRHRQRCSRSWWGKAGSGRCVVGKQRRG